MTNSPIYLTDELPGMLQRYRTHISEALRFSLSKDDTPVYDMLRYNMGWVDIEGNPCAATEGKALRPTLCLFGCEATGGSINKAMPAAIALELIHSFSLIHDDIQDHDETRHHRPTLWAKWGVPKALVAGNILRVVADTSLQRLVDEGVGIDQALAVVGMLTEAYLEMIEGQYLDISYEGRPDIAIDDYLNMISKKTGALIRCAVNLGAVIGTRDETTIEAFRVFGRSLGYVFQIRDDVLGVWGNEETTGKPVGADIRRKKNSLPVVYAMSQADPEDKQLLDCIYQKEQLSDGDVSAVLNVMERVNVKGYAQKLAQEHSDIALEALAGVELAPDMRRETEDLVHFLLVRQH
ncbi:MAG: polyprenyl synthetase family protein [Chloroflexi bacterium]|nr:polyprenyl synthetase family protein [Chloroflexota bacterium]